MSARRVTTEQQLDYASDGLYYLDRVPFTGVLECRSEDGTLEAEEEFRDGLLSGRKRAWHPGGGLELEAECALGAFHGRVRRWHESGQLASDAVYEYGIRVQGRAWDESGALVEDYALAESDPAFGLLQAFRKAEAAHAARGGDAAPDAAPDGGGM
jgi:antitoxin component YwqK of YwqJK toxin-antitoxin module